MHNLPMRKLLLSECESVSGSGVLELLPFGRHSTPVASEMAHADFRSGALNLGSLVGLAGGGAVGVNFAVGQGFVIMAGMGVAGAWVGMLAVPIALEILL